MDDLRIKITLSPDELARVKSKMKPKQTYSSFFSSLIDQSEYASSRLKERSGMIDTFTNALREALSLSWEIIELRTHTTDSNSLKKLDELEHKLIAILFLLRDSEYSSAHY